MTSPNDIDIHLKADGNAPQRLKAMEDGLNALARAGQQTGTTFDAAGATFAKLATRLDDLGAAHEESSQKVVDALNRYSEFGASVDQQRTLLNRLAQVSAKTGTEIALVARHAEELANELQDPAAATEALSLALEYTATTGLRVEDSVAALTETLTGRGMAAFDQFGQAGSDVGSILEGIRDKNLRAKAAAELLQAQMRQGPGVLSALGDRAKVLQAKLVQAAGGMDQLRLVGGGLATGLLAVGGAFVALGAKGVGTFLEQNQKAQASMEKASQGLDDLFYSLGGVILGWDQAAGNIDLGTSAIKQATEWVKKNGDQVGSWVRLLLKGALFVAEGFAEIVSGVAMVVTGVYEGVRGLFANVVVGAAHALELLIDLMRDAGLVSDETSVGVSDLRLQMEQLFDTEWDFSATEQIAGFLETVRGLSGEAEGLIDKLGQGDAAKAGARKRGGAGGGGERKTRTAYEAGFGGGFDQSLDTETAKGLANTRQLLSDLDSWKAGFVDLWTVSRQLTDSLEGLDSSGLERAGARLVLQGEQATQQIQQLRQQAQALEDSAASADEGVRQQIDGLRQQADQLERVAGMYGLVGQQAKTSAAAQREQSRAQREQLSLAQAYASVTDALAAGLQSMTVATLENVGAALAAGDAWADVGAGLTSMLANLVRAVVPILIQLAFSIEGIKTGNVALLLASAALLSVLAGALGSFGSQSSGAGSSARSSATQDRLSRDAERRAQETQTLVLTINVGGQQFDKRVVQVTREGQQRGALPGGNLLNFGRG